MPNRWLAGVLLFALGFGSAMMMKVPSTQAASKEGVVEGNLRFVNGERGDFQLIYSKPNKSDIFVAVALGAQRQATWQRGKVAFTKEQRKSLTIFRLTPVMKVTAQFANPCDSPELCPFPPDPEPRPGPGPRPFSEEELAFNRSILAFLGPDARRPGF